MPTMQTSFLTRLDDRLQVSKFFHWWRSELISLIPAAWRADRGLGNRVLIHIDLPNVTLYELAAGELHQLGAAQLKSNDPEAQKIAFQGLLTRYGKGGARSLSLYLMADQVLRKTISLPAIAAENLEQVLSFELDRHTPFKADQVYFSSRVPSHDAANHTLSVEIAVVPRDVINRALALVTSWDAALDSVLVEGDLLHTGAHFNLLPEVLRPPQSSYWRFSNIALMTLALVLLTAALAIPLWQKRQQTIALFPVVNKVRIAAQNADALHKELEQSVARHNFLLDKKRAAPPVTILLDEVSRLLPDDTWVQQFELKGRELQLVGETGSSSKLIGIIEQSNLLNEASFRSPLTKTQPGNFERFHLSAEVQPLPNSELPALIRAAQLNPRPVLPIVPKPAAASATQTPGIPGANTDMTKNPKAAASAPPAPNAPSAANIPTTPNAAPGAPGLMKPGTSQPPLPPSLPPPGGRPYANLPPGPPPVPGTYPPSLAPDRPADSPRGPQLRPPANPGQPLPVTPTPPNGLPVAPPGRAQ